MIPALAAIINVSSNLGYLLPAVIGLESMGFPSPGETALVLAAVLASQGKLSIVLVIAIGVASAIVGDNIGYWLGRRLGREVLEAPGPLQSRRMRFLDVGERFYQRHGPKAVFLGRWFALVRVATAWLAGINEMPFRVFLFWNALGGLTWGITVGLIGYYVGQSASNVISTVGLYGAIALGVALVAGLAYVKLAGRRAGAAGSGQEAEETSKPPAPKRP